MRSQLVYILYRGGQMAIAAEVAVILGLFIAVFYQGAPIINSTDLRVVLQGSEDLARQAPQGYIATFSLSILLPSLLMLWVIWAWHLYFQYTGVLVFHWVMTSIALIGLVAMLLSYSIILVGMGLYLRGLDAGYLDRSMAYPILGLVFALQFLGVFFTYWLYTGMVGVTLISQGKLSYVTVTIVGILFLIFNAFSIALSPFILGVMLLLRARRVANLPPLLESFETDG